LSTCVGGGIVGLPLAVYRLGIPLAVFLQVLVVFSTHNVSQLYLHVKDLVPGKPDSLYEIGYFIMGRASIFMLGSIFVVNSLGLCMIYFIVFGDTAGQLAASFTESEVLDSVWYTSRWCYSVPLAVLLIPICLKKELAELSWISVLLFVSLGLFALLNFIVLVFDKNFEALGYNTDVLKPKI
jgi:amino acid permease